MQMESLSWCLGQLGPVRPLGSTLRFPDGEEWYAFGLTTNRWYRQLSLLLPAVYRFGRNASGRR